MRLELPNPYYGAILEDRRVTRAFYTTALGDSYLTHFLWMMISVMCPDPGHVSVVSVRREVQLPFHISSSLTSHLMS